MKHICKTFMTAFFILMLSALNANSQDWGQFEKYQQQNKEMTEAPAVVFMGNSITEGWVKEHPDFFLDNNYAGRGISGQTTYQMLLRFRDDVINLHPQMVVINGGTNDVAENNHVFSEDRTFGNIVSMVELAEANGVTPVLTSLLPAAAFPWHPGVEDVTGKISSLNKRIKDYADSKGLIFVDYYSLMSQPDGSMNPSYSEDGVHPNKEGYLVMENIVTPLLSH